MIKYKQLRWGHCFSYGDNNVLDLDACSIIQLVGKNGHGKSSIALILEEVLFNKNSKGVKKQHILNRHSGSKSYWISLAFGRDDVSYEIKTQRGSTQTVSLLRNGEDISSHTATQTFKDIEALIGYDHKTFSQIVYQSSAASLEFLTATDSNRKKFLIDLLNLSRYTNALEVVKAAAQKVSKDVATWEGKLSNVQSWLAKYAQKDLTKMPILEVETRDEGLYTRRLELEKSIQNVASESRVIEQNLRYKELLEGVTLYPIPTEKFSAEELKKVDTEIAELKAESKHQDTVLTKLRGTKDKCPTCGAALGVDREHIEKEIKSVLSRKVELQERVDILLDKKVSLTKIQLNIQAATEAREKWEKYHALYDPKLPQVLPDAAALTKNLADINTNIKAHELRIKHAQEHNTKAAAHNASVDSISAQIAEFKADRETISTNLAEIVKVSSNYTVLTKAFSTTGLVAYKIECLVKDLEKLTNEYLSEMADGRFQIKFEISQSDKLNVVITDNGTDIDIAALSTGERARVNVATLLAIRKLMQSLSNTKTNLLVLDETIENLDAEGKERLIEILVDEPELNTVLISHSFTHPLIERVSIVKEKNISRIDK